MSERNQAVFLLRNSDLSQDLSLSSQREQCERFATQHGLQVLRILPSVSVEVFSNGAFTDASISGTKTEKRQAFQAMLKQCQAPNSRIRYVVCYDSSRFGRFDSDEAGYFHHILKQVGVEVVTVVDGFQDGDTGSLIRGVQQWENHQYVKRLSRVTQRGQIRVAELGFWCGGIPPFGYDLRYEDSAGRPICVLRFNADGSKHILRPNGELIRVLPRPEQFVGGSADRARLHPSTPERIAIVRELFELRAASNGFKRIAEILNKRGVATPRDGNWSDRHKAGWSHGSVRTIIMNQVYLGHLVYNRSSLSPFHQITNGENGPQSVPVSRVAGNQSKQLDETNWIITQNTHPPLISEDLWKRSRGGQPGKRRPHARGSVANYIFSGLIDCVACNHRFHGHTTTKSKPRQDGTKVKTRCYVCGGYVSKGTAVCPKRWSVNESKLWLVIMNMITKEYFWFLQSDGFASAIRERAEQIMSRDRAAGPERTEIEQKIQQIDRKIGAVMDLDPANIVLFNDQITELRKERETLQSRLLKAESGQRAPGKGDPAKVGAAIQSLFKTIENASPAVKRRFVGEFVDRIELDPREKKGVAWLAQLPKSVLDSLGLPVSRIAGAGLEPATSGL